MFNKKGQNIAEYSILVALVIAAAVAMQVYIKRGLQGRIADAVDNAPAVDLGEAGTVSFATKQYEPYYQDKLENVTSNRTLNEASAVHGQTARSAINETTARAAGSFDRSTWVGFQADQAR